MNKSIPSTVIERIEDNEDEVDTLKSAVIRLEAQVELGFNNTAEKLDKIDDGLNNINRRIQSIADAERDREVRDLRKKWSITTKVFGSVLLTFLGGLIHHFLGK